MFKKKKNMEYEKIFLPFQRIPTFQSVSFFALLVMTYC